MTEGAAPPHARPTPAQVRAKRREIAMRYAARFGTKRERIIAVRCGELRKILRNRHGAVLPDDVDSHVSLQILLRLGLRKGAAMTLAPWLDDDEIERLWTRRVDMNPEAISEHLGLTDDERAGLHIKTIPPCDIAKRDRKRQAKERHRARVRARAAAKRKARGAIPRPEYEATSKQRTKPWLIDGCSRATWYRRNRAAAPS
jgi:hypothetical protein